MPILMVRYEVADENVAAVVGAVERAFAATQEQQPEGIRWSYYRSAGSGEFVALVELDEGVENPLPAIEAARELQATMLKFAVGEPPAPKPLQLLGSYRPAR